MLRERNQNKRVNMSIEQKPFYELFKITLRTVHVKSVKKTNAFIIFQGYSKNVLE